MTQQEINHSLRRLNNAPTPASGFGTFDLWMGPSHAESRGNFIYRPTIQDISGLSLTAGDFGDIATAYLPAPNPQDVFDTLTIASGYHPPEVFLV